MSDHFVMIPLTKGRFAIVDEDDYPLVGHDKWHAVVHHRTAYARRNVPGSHGDFLFMHTVIAGYSSPDHVNGNGLDNRRVNLRRATPAQQQANLPRRLDNKSGYKGVSWHQGAGKWQAHVRKEGKRMYLGVFSDVADAARAYDLAAAELFGEFARLNFPHT